MNPVIAEKIRKLLNTSGRTEAEAETAQMLAAALTHQHRDSHLFYCARHAKITAFMLNGVEPIKPH